MTVYEVIDVKKRKDELTEAQLRFFVRAVADGSASDAQIAAFCMAVLLNGMTEEECFVLTDAMAASGGAPPRARPLRASLPTSIRRAAYPIPRRSCSCPFCAASA